jgi:hypothetical protein
MIHAGGPPESAHDRLRDNLAELPAADAALVSRVLPHFADMHQREFERVVEWTIDGLEHALQRRGAATARRAGKRGATKPRSR